MSGAIPSGPAAATGIAAINSIGNLGGFVPAMIEWIKDLTGSFLGGLYFVSGLLLVSAALTVMVAPIPTATSRGCCHRALQRLHQGEE